MIEWSLVVPSFFMVFAKAMQQQNVIHRNFLSVPITTYGIALCDVFLIVGVVDVGVTWGAVNGLALGGAVGCILAMVIHKKYWVKKK